MSDRGPEEELLVQGATRRVRRRWLVAAVLMVALAAAAVLVDREVTQREAAAIGRCAARTHEAVSLAQRRVDAMYRYVRPVLDNGAPTRLRDQMYALVSRQATGHDGALRRVRTGCSAIGLLPIHGELRRRRAACLELLDRSVEHLRAVALDGREVFRGATSPPGSAC